MNESFPALAKLPNDKYQQIQLATNTHNLWYFISIFVHFYFRMPVEIRLELHVHF